MSGPRKEDDSIPQIEPLSNSSKTPRGSPSHRRRLGSNLSAGSASGNVSPIVEALKESSQTSPRSKRRSERSIASAPGHKPSGMSHRSYDADTAHSQALRRYRAQTGIVGVSARFANASLTTAKSFRDVTGAVSNLVVPSFKTKWAGEIKEAGTTRSIIAFIVSFLTTLGLNFLLLFIFSRMSPYFGIADDVFEALIDRGDQVLPLLIAGGVGLFAFHVLDFRYSVRKAVKGIGFTLVVSSLMLLIIGTLFLTVEQVAAPILLWFFLVPVILLIIKRYLFYEVNNLWYLLGSAIALIIVSVSCISSFVLWFFFSESEPKRFTELKVEIEFWQITACDFDLNDTIAQNTFLLDGEPVECPQAFIIYVLPLVVGVYAFVFANILTFTFRAEEKEKNNTMEKPIEPIAQIFIVMTVIGIILTWVGASLFAAELAEVSSEVLYLSLIALATVGLIVASVFDVMKIRSFLLSTPLGVKVIEISESEWVDAFVVFLGLPIVAGYLILSMITQSIRRFSPLGKTLEEENEKSWWFTKESQWAVKRIMKWDLGSLLTKVFSLGVIWFVFVIIIGRLVNVALSALLTFLEEQGFGVVTTSAVFMATGLSLFMLPPVPGLPIYLTGGIILSQSARNEGYGIAVAGAIAVLVCSAVKMLSIVIQQKFIGQMLAKNSVAIRSAVGVNSLELRAMKKIMSVPGLTIPKVAVLVGGPDWPTSVLTGILGLPLCQMLLGSIPVLITIVPVCYAGALLIEKENDRLAQLNAILLSISVVVQLTPFFIAIHYIAKAAIDYAYELEQAQLDQEVLDYEKKNLAKKEWKIVLTKWKNFSSLGKKFHVFFAGLMIISNSMFTFLGDLNFESFELTDKIADQLDGNVLNILKPLGRVSLGLFIAAFIYMIVFGKIQDRRVIRAIENNHVLKEEERPVIEEGGFASLQGYSRRYFAFANNVDLINEANAGSSSGLRYNNNKVSHRQRFHKDIPDDIEEVI